MEVRHRREQGKLALSVAGRLDTGTSLEFEKALFDFIHAGENTLILDIKDVDYISSAGLRVFLKAFKTCKESGGQICLCGLKDYILEVFEVSGFVKLFPIYPTVDDAVKALV